MNKIQIFTNPDFGDVRTLEINGEAWFVGKDVAEILGYSNTNKAVQVHVDEEDKKILDFKGFSHFGNILWNDNDFSNKTIINESGLYSLILFSKMPDAKRFKHWITSEVLPAIRKHGAFMTSNTVEQILTNPDFIIKLATELKNEQVKNAELEAQAKENEPKVIFANALKISESSILIGELAKLLTQNGVKNMGQNNLFRFLRENGYIIRKNRSDYNMPTQKSMNLGLFEIHERPVIQPDGKTFISKTVKVTGKGQIYFINLFLGGR